MTALQQLLIDATDEVRAPDPGRLLDVAVSTADRHRARSRRAWLAGSVGVGALVIVGALAARHGGLAGPATPPVDAGGSSPESLVDPSAHPLVRWSLAFAVGLLSACLVGFRDRVRPDASPVLSVERVIGGLWGASLGLWIFGAFQLLRAAGSARYLGHPYLHLVSGAVIPVGAVAILAVGTASVRRVLILALAGQSAVVLSLLAAEFSRFQIRGATHWAFALTLAQIAAALSGAVWVLRASGALRRKSPGWPLAAAWFAGVPVLVNLFLYHSQPVTGSAIRWACWVMGGLATALVVGCLWQSRDRFAGAGLVLGLLVFLASSFAITLTDNVLPSIYHDWGPYLAGWWLAGLGLAVVLAVRDRAGPAVEVS